MRIYTVVERACEYNDSDYDLSEDGKPVKAFKIEENAEAERMRLEAEKRAKGMRPSKDDHWRPTDFYKVVAVDVEDEDVVSYASSRDRIKQLREEASKLAKAEFDKGVSRVFVDHPKLEKFSWQQYTPYFNDGDECVFGVHRESLPMTFNGVEHEQVSDWDFKYEKSRIKGDAELRSAYDAASAFLGQFDEADLKNIFGDHVEVVVTKDGAVAEKYDHD